MAKTNQSAGFRGLVHGSTKGGAAPFAGALTAGRNSGGKGLAKRGGKNTSGLSGAGPGGDLAGGKSPHGKPLKVS